MHKATQQKGKTIVQSSHSLNADKSDNIQSLQVSSASCCSALQPSMSCGQNTRRRILAAAIGQILKEYGYEAVKKDCLETLIEMMTALLVQIGLSARNYCEFSGRTVPVVGDVVLALANMGINFKGIEEFAKREKRAIIPNPCQQQPQKQTNLLQAGAKYPHPSHVPSYLPPFPDPHAYIRTPTHKQPVTEYEAIREKSASQKRDIEKALTKFLARTSETDNLFDTEDNMFPLIACKPSFRPYLSALNPTDQVFDFEELEYHYLVANRTEDCKDDEENESGNEEEGVDGAENNKQDKSEKEIKIENSNLKPNSSINKAILDNPNPNIDNPFLRAATLPKRAKPDPLLLAATMAAANKTAQANRSLR